MSLFNNRALTLLTLLFTLFLLSIPASAAPADLTAATFTINIYNGADQLCNSDDLTDVGEGPYVKGGGACFQYGGNAWWLVHSGGCQAQSWSGNNCRGSSTALSNDGFCHPVPFGSILVVC